MAQEGIIPLSAKVQNDLRKAERMKNEQMERHLKFDQQMKMKQEAIPFPGKKPFEKAQQNSPILRSAKGTKQILDSIVSRNPDGKYVSKEEYKYDNEGNITLYVSYSWDSNANAWVERSKSEYQYDNNIVISRIDYNWVGDVCTTTNYQYYYSSPTISDISPVYGGGVAAVFPNPATDYIIVKGDATSIVTVSNLSGGIIYKGTLADERKTIDVSSWANGIYIITVETGSNKTTSKIVKK